MLKTTKTIATTLLAFSGSIMGYAAELPVPPSVPATSTNAELEKSLTLLRQRIEALEKQVQSAQVNQVPNSTTITGLPLKGRVLSTLDLEIYGFIRADATYSNRKLQDCEDCGAYVKNTDEHDAASRFSVTPKFTRLGVNIKGPEVGGGKTSAKLEGDFAKNTEKEDESHGSVSPRLRHAFVKWEKDSWSVLAGQTDDLVKVVTPDQLNFNGLGYSGMLGTRHAQICVGKDFDVNDTNKIKTKVAAVRPKYSATGVPHAQGSIAWQTKFLTNNPTIVGISGICGKERFSTLTPAGRVKVWAVVGSLQLPMLEWLTFKANIFTGSTLGNYAGGIDQSVNIITRKGIKASGGWAQFTFTPIKKVAFNLGAGVDKPKKGDLSSSDGTNRFKNITVYANAIYSFTSAFSTGIEVAKIKTWLKGTPDQRKSASQVVLSATYQF